MVATADMTQADPVQKYRFGELLRMFPAMHDDAAAELAMSNDKYLLEAAKRLATHGCAAELAARILKPLDADE